MLPNHIVAQRFSKFSNDTCGVFIILDLTAVAGLWKACDVVVHEGHLVVVHVKDACAGLAALQSKGRLSNPHQVRKLVRELECRFPPYALTNAAMGPLSSSLSSRSVCHIKNMATLDFTQFERCCLPATSHNLNLLISKASLESQAQGTNQQCTQ